MAVRARFVALCMWGIAAWLLAGRLDYWGDEIGSLEGAAQPLGSILRGRGADFHPPLYFLLLHGWQRVFGSGEYATRSLSVGASVAAIALTAVLARRVGLGQPWRAAGLLALSPFWLLFCGMARYYSVAALVFVAALLALLHALRTGRTAAWALYAGAVALAGYTNYLMVAAVAATHGAWVCIHRRRCLIRWALSMACAAVLLVPLGALVLAQTRGMILWGERAGFGGQWSMAALGILYPLYVLAVSESILPWHLVLSLPLIGASFFLVARARRGGLLAVLGVGIATGVVIVLFVARSLPIAYLPSRLLFLAPVWAVLLASGSQRSRKAGTAALAVVAIGYGGGIANLVRGREYHNVTYLVPWRRIVAVIRLDREEDKLVVTPEEYPLLYYGRGLRFQLVRPGEKVTNELARKNPRAVWLVERDRADRQRQGITADVEAWLERTYEETDHFDFVTLSPMELKVRTFLLNRESAHAALTLTRFARR